MIKEIEGNYYRLVQIPNPNFCDEDGDTIDVYRKELIDVAQLDELKNAAAEQLQSFTDIEKVLKKKKDKS